MIVYACIEDKLVEVEAQVLQQTPPPKNIVWIDMLTPTPEETKTVEKFLTVEIPTKEEMQEIESSSRLYKEHDAYFMTINTVKKFDDDNHKIANITFLLKGNILLTIEYEDIPTLTNFVKLTSVKPTFSVESAISLLLGILEMFVDKIADMLETISSTIEQLSQRIFIEEIKKYQELRNILITMGLQGEINSKTRDSLTSISRMVGYLKFNISKEDEEHFRSRLETLNLDASDLKDHSGFLGHKVSFILDASLGLINIEQNAIIKIFSIAAVVLLPPTLIASIYGMNFKYMPELNWVGGYPLALIVMVFSSIIPYLYFKKKGWL